MAERTYQRQASGTGEPKDRTHAVEVAAGVLILVLVPAAFVAGWRTKRGLSRLMGY